MTAFGYSSISVTLGLDEVSLLRSFIKDNNLVDPKGKRLSISKFVTSMVKCFIDERGLNGKD